MATKLPYHKAFGFVVATRIASIFSVVGSSIIVATFIAFPFFRKPINRLVFYATLGNILTNVATLMSNSVLPAPGEPASGLCEFQGLLIQWFMVADSFWVLCMALNVFLVFFYGYGAQQLRHLEKWYFAFNYGIPCIPVIAYVVLSRTGHPVIGSAMLWCWVSVDVEWMRIAFFYVPAWVTILAAITIYSVTGYRIWQKQVELRYFSRDSNQFVTVRDPSDERESAGDVLSGRNNIVVTTRIECDTQQQSDVFRSVSPDPDCISINSFSSTQRLSSIRRPDVLLSGPLHDTSPIRISRLLEDVEAQLNFHHTPPSRSSYRATIIATSPPPEPKTVPPTAISKPRPPAKRTPEGHAAAMAYFYVAFLMFLALFVVWLPSSINRMYQFTHKDRPSFALNILSATVLPLQGAWNAIIYIFTTRAECRRAWSMIVEKITGRYAQYQPWREVSVKEMMTSSQATRESAVDVELSDILGHNRQARQIKSPKNDHMKDDDRCSKQISR